MCDISDIVFRVFTSVIAIIGFTSSIYFWLQKIGIKIKVLAWSIKSPQTEEMRVDDILLLNKKNKPVVITKLLCTFGEHRYMELKSKQFPLSLKSLENTLIKTEPYSHANFAGQKIKTFPINIRQFYICTGEKYFLCDKRVLSFGIKPRATEYGTPYFLKNYTRITTGTTIFNGKIYNQMCKYAITYEYLSQTYTSFLHLGGIFTEKLAFTPYNAIPKDLLSNAEKIGNYFRERGYDTLCEGIQFYTKTQQDTLK